MEMGSGVRQALPIGQARCGLGPMLGCDGQVGDRGIVEALSVANFGIVARLVSYVFLLLEYDLKLVRMFLLPCVIFPSIYFTYLVCA